MKTKLFILSLLLVACGVSRSWHTETYKGKTIVVGKVSPEILQKYTGDWFRENYDTYRPSTKIVEALKNKEEGVEVEIYMGTWCPDSREHVPAFYKIIDEAGWNRKKVKLIALPRKFKDEPIAREKHLIRVPTFIIYKDGKEAGRIIEYPMESLEKDLLDILEGHYRHELQDENP